MRKEALLIGLGVVGITFSLAGTGIAQAGAQTKPKSEPRLEVPTPTDPLAYRVKIIRSIDYPKNPSLNTNDIIDIVCLEGAECSSTTRISSILRRYSVRPVKSPTGKLIMNVRMTDLSADPNTEPTDRLISSFYAEDGLPVLVHKHESSEAPASMVKMEVTTNQIK